ncbi:MAG: HDOD domain-containing protein [Deltaproteobacteria bacterium]|nr:HDOD domain-containing protein [Deltaproteobacteria bacterium]
MASPDPEFFSKLSLPSPPVVLSQLLKMLAEDRSSATELAEVVLKDPGLTARVLRIANSPFYSFSNKIVTVSHAIALLGFRTIRIICAGESFLAIFPARLKGVSRLFHNYCRHSLLVALLARNLAESLAPELDSEKVFIAGLLHDMGKPVLWYNFPEQAAIYNDLRRRDFSESEAEQLAYGIDHATVGAWVAGEWGLDSELAKTMAHHHEVQSASMLDAPPVPAEYSLLKIVGLANILARCLQVEDGGRPPAAAVVDLFVRRNLPGLDWPKLFARLSEEAGLYEIDLSPVGVEDNGVAAARSSESFPESKVGKEAEADGGEELLRRSLTLFNAYNSFLDNFNLNDIFAGSLVGLRSLPGVVSVWLMLYRPREEALVIQSAAGACGAKTAGHSFVLEKSEVESLRSVERLLFPRAQAGLRPAPETALEKRLAGFFLDRVRERGLFLPVFSENRLLGGFCLGLDNGFNEDDVLLSEMLSGYAVQLVLALRFYKLSRKLQLRDRPSPISPLMLAYALKTPLAVLQENIYLLEQEGRNAGFARTGYRQIYCQKMRRALEDIAAVMARCANNEESSKGALVPGDSYR